MKNLNPWKSEEIEYLIAHWTVGVRAAAIGKHLGRTRMSIIGKADRMGLARQEPIVREPKVRKPRKSRANPHRVRPLTGIYRNTEWSPPPQHETGRVPLLDIKRGQCRFVAAGTAGADTLMCGEPIFRPPYCGYHGQLCYKTKNAPALTRAVVSEAVPSGNPVPPDEGAASL